MLMCLEGSPPINGNQGLGVVEEAIRGVERPLALVGVAEKGYATLELSVDFGSQGHSSRPHSESAVGILARAVGHLEENKQPSQFGKRQIPNTRTYDGLGPT